MTFIALHRGDHTSLATDTPWLTGDDVTRAADARTLLERLERLTATREAELAAAREQARAEGHAAGREAALAEAAPRLWDAWDQAARNAAADAGELRAALVSLALQVVDRIAAEVGPAATVSALAAQAAQQLLPDAAAIVRVHPDVASAVRARVAGAPGVLDVRADAALGRFDCVFETPAGRLLADLPVQLQRLSTALQGSAR